MKVYLVEEYYNNNELYEDNFTRSSVIKAFANKDKARDFIKNYIPKDYHTREEAEKILREKWDGMPDEDIYYYNNFENYFKSEAQIITNVSFNPDAEDTDIKVVDCHTRFEDPSFFYSIIELEVEE